MKKILIFFSLLILSLSIISCKSEVTNKANQDVKESHIKAESKTSGDRKVYINGKVFTSNRDMLYADGFVVEDGKFLFVGKNDELKVYAEGLPSEDIIDLNGKRVIPGLLEGHTHMTFMSVLDSLHYCEVDDNIGLKESLDELKKYVKEHPDYDQYVLGNFSQNFDLTGKMIDEICGDKPVMLLGMGFHCGYMNTLFMKNGNITKDTKDAVPGESFLIRDEDGNPTGKIVELPQTWDSFKKAIKIDNDKVALSLKNMIKKYNEYGFTGVTEGGFLGLDEENMLSILKGLEDKNDLNLLI
ncbi:MAG: amidohydrolase family protein, partial [Lachnospiraceae bacterium]|nr:amidohydrolase family protein [Lachnospiraceae bacterium]